jgi:3-oxoacyl-(acyl-carrier-protein) synthase
MARAPREKSLNRAHRIAVSSPGAAAAPVVAVTGMEVLSAFGRGVDALAEAVFAGASAFGPVARFDASRHTIDAAAAIAGAPDAARELTSVVGRACDHAGLSAAHRAESRLLLATCGDLRAARRQSGERHGHGAASVATALAQRLGLSPDVRGYTTACVAASTAISDAGALIRSERAVRVVVAAAYLVEADRFALFQAGGAIAKDGCMRPFSQGRSGIVLGDGVAAVVLESWPAARRRDAPVLARLAGWGRAGDAVHVIHPDPAGRGLARAIASALARAGVSPGDLDYINAHGVSGAASDRSECAALRAALGRELDTIPASSTKGSHGHALEATALLELVATIAALCRRRLPVNAGTLAVDPACPLALVAAPRAAAISRALSVNSAFGGANTALVIEAA